MFVNKILNCFVPKKHMTNFLVGWMTEFQGRLKLVPLQAQGAQRVLGS